MVDNLHQGRRLIYTVYIILIIPLWLTLHWAAPALYDVGQLYSLSLCGSLK